MSDLKEYIVVIPLKLNLLFAVSQFEICFLIKGENWIKLRITYKDISKFFELIRSSLEEFENEVSIQKSLTLLKCTFDGKTLTFSSEEYSLIIKVESNCFFNLISCLQSCLPILVTNRSEQIKYIKFLENSEFDQAPNYSSLEDHCKKLGFDLINFWWFIDIHRSVIDFWLYLKKKKI